MTGTVMHELGPIIQGSRIEMVRWDGIGTPILLLHEGLGSVAMWRDLPEHLAVRSGGPVVAWSRRGYGQSDGGSMSYPISYMHEEADLVPQILDALNIERAVLFGHSDGGSIALIAAARFPDRIAALILEAPHVYVEQRTLEGIARMKQTYLNSNLEGRLGRYHRDPGQVFWRWNNVWMDSSFRRWSIEDMLPSVRAPALLIQGLDDEYGSLDQLDRIEASLSKTRRLELPDCGHSPHHDQPDAVLTTAAEFLKDVASD